jgi:hypothetical protein
MAALRSPYRALVIVLVLAAAAPSWAQTGEPTREAALALFHQRVDAYVALHRRLEACFPPLRPTKNPNEIAAARQLLALAIRQARANAQQGAIFTPGVADVFRGVINETYAGRDLTAMLAELPEEYPPAPACTWPVVNQPYPPAASHEVPSLLLQALPPLPDDLEYRILDRHLVLWDGHANLIVDFIPYAFGPETTD